MEVKVEYTGTETEQRLAELEHKTHQQTVEISDEIMKKAIQRKLVVFSHGLMMRDYVKDRNGNLVYEGNYSSACKWKYKDWDKIQEIVAELVWLSEIKEKNEKEQKIQKQEQEEEKKEEKRMVDEAKREARTLIGDEIDAMKTKISGLTTELKKYKDREESREKQAEEREGQEKIRKIKAKGFDKIKWDSEKYKEIDGFFDDYETLERVRLIDDNATAETWKDRDSEETITVYSAAGKYFVEG